MSNNTTSFTQNSNSSGQNVSESKSDSLFKNDISINSLPTLPSVSDNEEFLFNSFYSDNNTFCTKIDEFLVGKKESLNLLEFEFQSNPVFLRQIRSLKFICPFFRRIKKDGCCFYRAFLFGLSEHLLRNKQKIFEFIDLIKEKRNLIEQVGYTMCTVEDFYQEFIDTITKLSEPDSDITTLEELNNSPSTANYLIVFLRLLTATYMKQNRAHFENFIESHNIDEFCKTDVDPMWVEAEQMQIIALCSILDVPICIYCLDSSTPNYSVQIFPNTSDTPLFYFLYRPGHYELLYCQIQDDNKM